MRTRGRPPYDDQLTPAEWRVVDAARHGLTNPQIARRRGVSVDAIKYHIANALQKLGFTRRAELRGWNGVPRASALFSKEPVLSANLALGPIGQVARTVKDISAARTWYGETLGLTHLYSFGDISFFDCGGVRLFLSEGEGSTSESILYFRVDDVRTAQAALAARGVAFTHAPHMIHKHADGVEEWMSFFEDNEARPLAIMSHVKT